MSVYTFLPKLLNMSLTASVVIIFVLVLRLFLKKAPKVISYALWSVVLFRLLCPVSIESELSLFAWLDVPAAEVGKTTSSMEYTVTDSMLYEEGTKEEFATSNPITGNQVADTLENTVAGSDITGIHNFTGDNAGSTDIVVTGAAEPGTAPVAKSDITEINSLTEDFMSGVATDTTTTQAKWNSLFYTENNLRILTSVWFIGVIVMGIYAVYSYLQLKKSLLTASPLRENIYLADDIASPFVLGVVRPKIYLPSNMTEKEQKYILLHEKHHIRRGDHMIKFVAFIALSIHWFNPLVWVAFIYAAKDMEMSCDEAVIRKLGAEVLADYSTSLLNLATGKHVIHGMPLAFGEGDTKERIKNLAKWKKPVTWVCVVAVIICTIIGIVLLTNPVTDKTTDVTHPSDVKNEVDNSEIPSGEKLEAIYYNDTCYYGLVMSNAFKKGEEPENFTYIGKLEYIVDGYQSPIRHLNATFGVVGDDIYHYVDEEGRHNFCTPIEVNKYTGLTRYQGICKATTQKPDYYTDGTEKNVQGGIYYGKESEKDIGARYLDNALYAGSFLLYNGRMYKVSNSFDDYDKSNLRYETIVKKELGTVSSNHYIYWSEDSEMLHEVTSEGTLYSIKSYDESVRVGILYAQKINASGQDAKYKYCFNVYDSLNDITLLKGTDLFQDMYHLEDTVRVNCSLIDVDGQSRQTKNTCEVPVNDSIMTKFIQALNEGYFIDPMSADYPKIPTNTTKDYVVVHFYDSQGLAVTVEVYEKGFVNVSHGKDMCIAVEAELCKQIIAMANMNSMVFREVSEVVTAKDVTNLRSVPGTMNTENIVAQLLNGETLTRTGLSMEEGWSRLEYNGETVYAVTQYLTMDLTYESPVKNNDPNRVLTNDKRAIVFTDCNDWIVPKEYVNLRTEPSTSQGEATVFCQIESGIVLQRTGYSEESGWSRVEYNGKILYAVSSMVNPIEISTGNIKLNTEGVQYTAQRMQGTLDYNINITDSDNHLLQNIEYSYDVGDDTPVEHGIYPKDVNHDGYEDILIKLEGHGNIGPVWACYVYDKNMQQFVYVEGFEEILGLEIDEEIRSYYYQGGGVYYRLERYLIDSNKLVLEGRLIQELQHIDSGDIVSCTEEHYENGRIVYLNRDCSVEEIDMEFWKQDIGESLKAD